LVLVVVAVHQPSQRRNMAQELEVSERQPIVRSSGYGGLPPFFVDGVAGTPHSSSTSGNFTLSRTMDYSYLRRLCGVKLLYNG
jgi:hypothetical protein